MARKRVVRNQLKEKRVNNSYLESLSAFRSLKASEGFFIEYLIGVA
jgi:hypothetical protein